MELSPHSKEKLKKIARQSPSGKKISISFVIERSDDGLTEDTTPETTLPSPHQKKEDPPKEEKKQEFFRPKDEPFYQPALTSPEVSPKRKTSFEGGKEENLAEIDYSHLQQRSWAQDEPFYRPGFATPENRSSVKEKKQKKEKKKQRKEE